MSGYGDAPSFVMALPAPVRRQILRQCGGDWSRVTRDDSGIITVHNRPQLVNIKEEVAAVVLKSAEDPAPEPPPPPRPALPPIGRPKKPPVDTSDFKRIEVPMKGRRKADRLAPPATPEEARDRLKLIEASPEQIKAVTPPKKAVPKPPTQDTLFRAPAPAPAPVQEEAPAAAGRRFTVRTGKPRSAVELLKRLLDLGCTYKRQPRSVWATVRYQGHSVGSVHCADSTPLHVIRADYRQCRRQIWTVKQILRP